MTMIREVVHAANSEEVLSYADRIYPIRDRLKIQKVGTGRFKLAVGILEPHEIEAKKKSYTSVHYPGKKRNHVF